MIDFHDLVLIKSMHEDVKQLKEGIVDKMSINPEDYKKIFDCCNEAKDIIDKEVDRHDGADGHEHLIKYLKVRRKCIDDLAFGLSLCMQGNECLKGSIAKFSKQVEDIQHEIETDGGETFIEAVKRDTPDRDFAAFLFKMLEDAVNGLKDNGVISDDETDADEEDDEDA